MNMAKTYVTEFNRTGNCVINVLELCKQWQGHRFYISQWGEDKFTVIKRDLRSKEENLSNIQISREQAEQVIDWLGLEQVQSPLFRSGSTWYSPFQAELVREGQEKVMARLREEFGQGTIC